MPGSSAWLVIRRGSLTGARWSDGTAALMRFLCGPFLGGIRLLRCLCGSFAGLAPAGASGVSSCSVASEWDFRSCYGSYIIGGCPFFDAAFQCCPLGCGSASCTGRRGIFSGGVIWASSGC